MQDAAETDRLRDAGDDQDRATCKLVADFHDRCFAYSFDPQDETPGFGWAVADDQRGAEQQALANCEKTAGPKRRAACIVVKTGCDGTAK
jgi:uncharacterized protein DUF4189